MPGASLTRTAGMNLYTYVGNDPINYVDPLGLEQWCFSVTDPSEIEEDGTIRTRSHAECVLHSLYSIIAEATSSVRQAIRNAACELGDVGPTFGVDTYATGGGSVSASLTVDPARGRVAIWQLYL